MAAQYGWGQLHQAHPPIPQRQHCLSSNPRQPCFLVMFNFMGGLCYLVDGDSDLARCSLLALRWRTAEAHVVA